MTPNNCASWFYDTITCNLTHLLISKLHKSRARMLSHLTLCDLMKKQSCVSLVKSTFTRFLFFSFVRMFQPTEGQKKRLAKFGGGRSPYIAGELEAPSSSMGAPSSHPPGDRHHHKPKHHNHHGGGQPGGRMQGTNKGWTISWNSNMTF